jgi:hypothetical protein
MSLCGAEAVGMSSDNIEGSRQRRKQPKTQAVGSRLTGIRVILSIPVEKVARIPVEKVATQNGREGPRKWIFQRLSFPY